MKMSQSPIIGKTGVDSAVEQEFLAALWQCRMTLLKISRLAISLKVDLVVIGHHGMASSRAGGREKTMRYCLSACRTVSVRGFRL
jgi:hypothetical protein